MEVILKEDINKLGYKDDVVTIKAGFGRNFLIPQGKAILATVSAKKQLEETLRQRAHKEAKLVEELTALASKLKGLTIKVEAKVGENGKIFGSVSNVQLADAIKKNGLDVERKAITLKSDVKTIGKYEASVKLHKTIVETVEFEVVEG